MHGMRQRLLSESNISGSQNPAHGGVASQMPGVREEFQSAEQSEDPLADAHRHQTVPLRFLRQGVPAQLRFEETLTDAQPGHGDVALVARVDPRTWI